MCDIEKRQAFQEHLNDTYETFCEPFHEIKVKHLCVAYVDGNWCRGKIVEFHPSEQQSMVYLLDYGRTVKSVSQNDLCLLKYTHASIQPFVIACQLSILNGVALNLKRRKRKELFIKLKRIARDANDVCICLNGSMSKKNDTYIDTYIDVLLLTDQPANDGAVCDAYSLHEAYGAFYRPKMRFDHDMCEFWFKHIGAMEMTINSDTKNKVPVILSHIVSPFEFYVQCEAVKMFMSKIRRIIDAHARAQMANHDFNRVRWTIGDNCLVRMQNWKTKANLKLWYRGEISALYNDKYKVFLRDYGRSTEVTRADLMVCSPELAKCSNAVQKCTLNISRRWTPSGTDLFNRSVGRYQSFAISCVRKIKLNVHVDLWATNSSSPDIGDFPMWENIGYTIICTAIRNAMQPFILETQLNYNRSKPKRRKDDGSHIRLSLDDDYDIGASTPADGGAGNSNDGANDDNDNEKCDNDDDIYAIQGDLLAREPIATKWLKPLKIERNSFCGVVTHITDRGIIYVQEEANYELAHDISVTISEYMLKVRGVCSTREWKTGDTCFAEFEENRYHRAVIKRIYPEYGTCLVSKLDVNFCKIILRCLKNVCNVFFFWLAR